MKKLLLFMLPLTMQAQTGITFYVDTTTPPPFYDVLYTDEENNPFTFTEYQFYARGNPYVVICTEDGQQVTSGNFYVPQQFVRKVKITSSMSVAVLNAGDDSFPLPDSIALVDQVALDSFYHSSSMPPIDSIYISSHRLTDFNASQYYERKIVRDHKRGVLQGKETGYYDIHELNGIVVRKNFRIKYTGHWKNDKQNGKWMYYSKDGTILKTEHWHKGKLKRTKLAK